MLAALKKCRKALPIESEVVAGERSYSGFTISSLITQALFSHEENKRTEVRTVKSDMAARQNLGRLERILDRQMQFAPFHLGANRTYQAPIIFNQYQGSELATIVAPFLEKGFIRRGRAEKFLNY